MELNESEYRSIEYLNRQCANCASVSGECSPACQHRVSAPISKLKTISTNTNTKILSLTIQ